MTAAGSVAFAVLAVLVHSKWAPLRTLDIDVADDVNRYVAAHPVQVDIWRTVSAVGSPAVLRVAALGGAVLLWIWHRRRAAALVIVTMLGAALLGALAKTLVRRPRPVVPEPVAHVGDWSFPSSHALTSFVGMGLLLVVALPGVRGVWRVALVAAAGAVVAAVGFSRVALGVHYASDVAGGWVLGGTWLLATVALLRRLERRSGAAAPADM
ncbi:MAG TPA: phosphatase PAP2 family protein [Pseudonocardiaceae bacterium]|jgi:undecaprenyl-diphosphatase